MSLTRDEIIAVLGPSDEELLAEIIATGASAADLAEAWAWLNADDALIQEGRAPPTGKVAELIDLLIAGPEEPEP